MVPIYLLGWRLLLGDIESMVNLLLCEPANTTPQCNMFAELEAPNQLI